MQGIDRKQVQKRIIVTRLGLDLLRGASANILGEPEFGSAMETQVITMAVALGQLEHRAMSTSKLAEYVGIPRATVTRKLQMLEARGVLERNRVGAYIFTDSEMKRPQVWAFIDSAARLIHTAAFGLSKLDT